MKNIKMIKRAVSLLVLVLTLASSILLVSCGDPHAGHDHGDGVDLSILNSPINVAKPVSYPTVTAYTTSEVKKNLVSEGFIIFLVVKVDDNQIYCASNNAKVADYIIVGSSLDVKVGDYFVCDAPVYAMTAEEFGFEPNVAKIDTFYVVYAGEMKNPLTITKENAAKLFTELLPPDLDDDHAGHDH